MKARIYLGMTSAALLAGAFIGWSTVFAEVNRYCEATGEGLWGLRHLGDAPVANPLLAPCFWGSIAFVVALAWALYLLLDKDPVKKYVSLRKLWWLLLSGTLFALVNNAPILYRFYTKPKGSVTGCSADVVTNPYVTGCFLGFAAFTAAFLCASLALRSVRKSSGK